jgi:hypothetical protein
LPKLIPDNITLNLLKPVINVVPIIVPQQNLLTWVDASPNSYPPIELITGPLQPRIDGSVGALQICIVEIHAISPHVDATKLDFLECAPGVLA